MGNRESYMFSTIQARKGQGLTYEMRISLESGDKKMDLLLDKENECVLGIE